MRKQIHDINGVLIDFSNTLFDCRNVISPEKIVQKLKTKGASIDVITAQDFCDAILENANSEDGLKERIVICLMLSIKKYGVKLLLKKLEKDTLILLKFLWMRLMIQRIGCLFPIHIIFCKY